jgi:hypothetical protein
MWVYPCKTREAEELKVCLEHWFKEIKIIPKVLHSDREFVTNILRNLAKNYKFRAVWSSAYQPNANSVVERANGTLKRMLYSHMEKFQIKVWVDSLQKIVYSYNHSLHSTTKKRPVDLLKAEKETIEQVDKDLIKTRKRKTDMMMEKFKEEPLKVGDLVRINRTIYPSVRKNIMLLGKKSFVQRWSSDTYNITKVFQPLVPGRIYEYMVNNLRYKFKQNQLLKVNTPDQPLKKPKQ